MPGIERVHLNARARKLLHKESARHSKIRGERTIYADITAQAVRDSLWWMRPVYVHSS